MLHYETIPVTPFQQNCTVVWEDQGMTAAIIDPGGDLDMLQSACKQLGAHSLQVRHCPGHTPGHVVFYSPEIQRAFVGDVLFAGSIGRTDFPQGNHQDLLDSIVQRLWPMGDDTVFIPGHGPESTFGRERRSNPYVGGT